MNADFEDVYGQRLRRTIKRRRIVSGFLCPAFIAIAIIIVLSVINILIKSG